MSHSKQIQGIQLLRGFAALAVVVDHSAGMTALPKYFGKKLFAGVLEWGSLGVDIFFVLSGFIISFVALNSDCSPKVERSSFFKSRFIRIIPLMWLAIISYGVLRLYANPSMDVIGSYLRAFFLIPWGDVDPNQIWTLRHEALFYIIFALTMLRRNQLIPILALWFVAPLLFYPAAYAIGASIERESFLGVFFRIANVEFGLGFVIGLLYLRRGSLPDFSKRHPFGELLALSLACVAAAGAAKWIFPHFGGQVIAAILCSVPVIFSIGMSAKTDRFTRVGILLGDASYAIYLFHSHLLSAILLVMAKVVPAAPIALVVLTVATAATAFGIFVHLIIEKPLVSGTRKILAVRAKSPPPIAGARGS